MNKCRYFRIVKIIYGNESKIENSFGFCCKDGYENDELLSCFEPSCCCFSLSKENDPVID